MADFSLITCLSGVSKEKTDVRGTALKGQTGQIKGKWKDVEANSLILQTNSYSLSSFFFKNAIPPTEIFRSVYGLPDDWSVINVILQACKISWHCLKETTINNLVVLLYFHFYTLLSWYAEDIAAKQEKLTDCNIRNNWK